MKKIILHSNILIFIFFIASCAPLQKGLVVFEEKQDEIIATQRIKDFMKSNPNPSIVLRVPITEKQATQSDPNSFIYNAIEKEFVLGGFQVKDRALFNEVVSRSENLDYTKLKEITGTELIIELIRNDRNVEHTTNRIYSKKNEEILSNESPIIRYGAAVEFKLVIVDGNDYGGSYSFYYTPCTERPNNDCNCIVGYKTYPSKKVYPQIPMCTESKKVAYEYVDQNVMEELVRQGVKLMINEIRAGSNITQDNNITSSSKTKKASVITNLAEDIGFYSAKLSGTIISDAGSPILQRGFCYSSTNHEPQTTDNIINEGIGTGLFSSTLINLSPKTNYFFRAYATNSAGTSYGSVMEFSTSNKVLYDVGGNFYNIVEIGKHVWMAENLRTNKLNDGTPIKFITKEDVWGESKIPYYCFYNNAQSEFEDKYGALYNWYAVNTGKLCPIGWHVPTSIDFLTLETILGGAEWAGGRMKEKGSVHWQSPNIGGTNKSGFSALPAGRRNAKTSSFEEEGKSCFFWTTLQNENSIQIKSLYYLSEFLIIKSALPDEGASVRCIKDPPR